MIHMHDGERGWVIHACVCVCVWGGGGGGGGSCPPPFQVNTIQYISGADRGGGIQGVRTHPPLFDQAFLRKYLVLYIF